MPSLKKFPTSSAGSTSGDGSLGTWLNPNRIFVTDGSMASSAYWLGGGGGGSGLLKGSVFGFNLPAGAVIDGIQVDVVGGYFNRIGATYFSVGTAAKTAYKNTPIVTNGTQGGPTDLWGRTDWTAADINDSTFAAGWSADVSSSPADAQANIDSIAVTVYYHLGGPVAPADVPIREIYKVYDKTGQYIGNLPNPIEPLKLGQDINSLGSQIAVKIPYSIDISSQPTDPYITEDASATYTDEAGAANYVADGPPPIVSAAYQDMSTLIKNGNTVEAWLYNYWYPNGKCMFVGKMRRWEANFGNEADGNTINVLLYSNGYDLDNYTARGAPFSYTLDQSNNTWNVLLDATTYDRAGWNYYGQSFTPGAGVTNIAAISVGLVGVAQCTLNLYDGMNGALLASSTQNVAAAGPNTIQFGFPSLVNVTPGQQYFFDVRPANGQTVQICWQNTDVYAGGGMAQSSYSGGSGGGSYGPVYGDLYFQTYSGTPSTVATFTSKDPTTQMLAPFITDYNLRGGTQKWTVASIDATGLSLTYTFSVQTLYEAMKAILSLAPNGFYFYIDLGTQTIYFKNQSTVAEFLFIKGVHINSLSLVTTTENTINQVLFTGGEISPGVNLYKIYNSQDSQAAFGPLLDRKSDNRVTLDATANAIGVSEIAERSGEQYQTTITIPHTKDLDITLLVPGKVVGFRGFGSFVDVIIAQIVHRDWTAESVTLTLGILPTRLSYEYNNTTRQLIAEQTQNNPGTPT